MARWRPSVRKRGPDIPSNPRRLTIDPCNKVPAADNPRIEEIKALFARPIDLPVLLADQHRLALVDGDLRWADLDLDRHAVLPLLAARHGWDEPGLVLGAISLGALS